MKLTTFFIPNFEVNFLRGCGKFTLYFRTVILKLQHASESPEWRVCYNTGCWSPLPELLSVSEIKLRISVSDKLPSHADASRGTTLKNHWFRTSLSPLRLLHNPFLEAQICDFPSFYLLCYCFCRLSPGLFGNLQG